MARGRKPDPAAVRKAKGNPGKRPVGEDPSPAAGDASPKLQGVAAPSWLGDAERDIWNEHAPTQLARKLLTESDVIAFGRYCVMLKQWIDCKLEMDENGMTYEVKSKHGEYRRPSPSFVMMKGLNLDMLRIEDRYGMNPAERQRIFASRAGGKVPGELPFSGGANGKRDEQNPRADEDPDSNMPSGTGPVGLLN